MKTIWLTGKDEEKLISIGEVIGEELINRDQNVELIVQSEIQEILGRGLKDSPEDNATFADRLGFLGNLLNRNNIFAIVVSNIGSTEDRKKVKEVYGNLLEFNEDSGDIKSNVKKVIDALIKENLISEDCQSVYSEDEEEEIRKRLEDLGYV